MGMKFVSLLIELVGLPGCAPDFAGNNLANFVLQLSEIFYF